MSTLSVKTNKSHAKSIFRKVVPIAAGVDVFGSLARWTEETFHFNDGNGTPAAETGHPPVGDKTYRAIQTEVDNLDIDVPVVPTWFPDGYELQEIQLPDPDITAWKDVYCLFRNEDEQTLRLRVAKYEEDYDISSMVFEKDGQPVKQYLGNDKLFYIMSNNSSNTAAWSDGRIVVSISGSLTEETIKSMIDSIGGYKS